jgi:sulfite exporter TauE/SafE
LTPNMKKSNYTLLVLVALTIINIFSDFLVEFIAGVFGDDVKNNVSKQTLLIIFAVLILFTLALIIFQYFHEKNSADSSANNLTDSIEPDIKLLFNSLT